MRPRTDNPLEALFASTRAERRPVILDGAMGTELDNRAVPTDTPLWSGLAPLTASKMVHTIHREYVDVGADIITTCTFRTTDRAFKRAAKPPGQWREAATQAAQLAKRAASPRTLVAGSLGPLEDCFMPQKAPDETTARREHRPLAALLDNAAVDLFLVETMGTLGELRGALKAVRDVSAKPIISSLTTLKNGTLLSGEPLQAALEQAVTLGAAAVCINCIPPTHLDTALPILAAHSPVPFGFYANLGLADPHQDWSGQAHLSPEEYTKLAAHWFAQGASIIGGCCGSQPAHIQALKEEWRPSS